MDPTVLTPCSRACHGVLVWYGLLTIECSDPPNAFGEQWQHALRGQSRRPRQSERPVGFNTHQRTRRAPAAKESSSSARDMVGYGRLAAEVEARDG